MAKMTSQDIITEAINGYEEVIQGRKSGQAYLTDFIEAYQIDDDELIYLVYMAADIIARRSQLAPAEPEKDSSQMAQEQLW